METLQNILKMLPLGAGGLAQRFRTLTAPVWQLTTIYNSISMVSNALFWPLWASGMYAAHEHTCRQNTYVHKI